MAAMLIEIKSRMLLPVKKADSGEEAEDPRAELVRRLLEYEQMKLAAQRIDQSAATRAATSCAPRSTSSKASRRAFRTWTAKTCAPRGPT